MKKNFTKTIKDLEQRVGIILDMWENSTIEEIGKKLNVSKQRISQIVNKLRKNGLPVPMKKLKKIDWKEIIEKYKSKYEN